MAVVTTTVTPVVSIDPYTGVDELLQNRSDFPRSEIRHTRRDVTIAATGVGDNQFVSISGNMPQNFAYCLTDLFFSLESAAGNTNNFDTTIAFGLIDSLSTGSARTWELHLPNLGSIAVKDADQKQIMAYHFQVMPSMVMSPPTGHQIGYELSAFNGTANDGAYLGNFYARFQQFDINQTINAAVNRQTPVRTR